VIVGGFGGFGVEQVGHRFLGQVAAVADLPFVVDLVEHGAGEAEQRCRVGEDADDVGAAFDLPVDALERFDQIFFQCAVGKSAKAVISSAASRSMVSTLGNCRPGRNVARDPRCSIALSIRDADVVIEGDAVRVTEPGAVARIAKAWADQGWPAEPDESGSGITTRSTHPRKDGRRRPALARAHANRAGSWRARVAVVVSADR
jgi:hypothetical protein